MGLSPRGSILVAILGGVFLQRLYNKVTIYQQPLDKTKFGHTDFTTPEVPTTYYHQGHIQDVLKDWDHSFRLYRLYPNETFEFDFSKANSKVRAKALLEDCPWTSSLCKPCFDPSRAVQEVDTATIFKEHGWYASFAKISDEAVSMLWDLVRLPFDVSTTVLEHAFISNLKDPMVTAGIHANPSTSSMAVQFVGHKTWLFFSSDTYLNQMNANPSAPILLPRQSPKKEFEVFVYTSEPGDVLFFPESWAHTVYTHDGPNVMVNYRRFHIMNIVRQPLTWISSTINNFRSPIAHSAGRVAGNNLQQQSVPEKAINVHAYQEMDKMCTGGDVTEFDSDMLNLMMNEYKRYTAAKN